MLFTGQERDYATGMDYFGARYYRADLGRFTTVDPGHVNGDTGDTQSWSPYASVRNNPLRYTDPTGTDYWIYGEGGTPFVHPGNYGMLISLLHGDGFYPVGGEFNGDIFNSLDTKVGRYEQIVSDGPVTPGPGVGPDTPAGGGSGGSPAGAFRGSGNGQRPWYKNSCITDALTFGAIDVAADAVGLIPGVGGAKTVARRIGNRIGYKGIVADRYGKQAIKQLNDRANAYSLTQGLGGRDWVSVGLDVAGFVPGLGQGAAGLSIGYDLYRTITGVGRCN
jgi:RHS repeat-associated protein